MLFNPSTANNNNCRLLCNLLVNFKSHFCKQCGPRSDFLIWVHTVCLYAKIGLINLQEYSAEDINRRHFQMQVFLAFKGLNKDHLHVEYCIMRFSGILLYSIHVPLTNTLRQTDFPVSYLFNLTWTRYLELKGTIIFNLR